MESGTLSWPTEGNNLLGVVQRNDIGIGPSMEELAAPCEKILQLRGIRGVDRRVSNGPFPLCRSRNPMCACRWRITKSA
jgi:hypothetical protein